ncbi:hypothetical protein GCM10017567_74320 [Amycolatopsis bullii]|uniref:Transposase IS4-like domain-containing protein n=1 Tax=Amycolatopsis bullii TaxID=941987 RepID=A0ABQ3KPT6_9PSEU|nr:hypothetical protein GCM10017567_74320 [Amycolatopsis bullii]
MAISTANTHDIHALKPLIMAIPAIKSRHSPRRRKPAKLHADKASDQPGLRRWVRDRGIKVRIARKGIETSKKPGKHRWVIERTMAWLTDTAASPCATNAKQSTSSPSSSSAQPSPATRSSANSPHETSSQTYYESAEQLPINARIGRFPPLPVPLGVAVFPHAAFVAIRRFAERDFPTIIRWTEYDRGGHYPAMEEPDLFVEDVRMFARALKKT